MDTCLWVFSFCKMQAMLPCWPYLNLVASADSAFKQGTFAAREVSSQIWRGELGGGRPTNNSIILYLFAYKMCATYSLGIPSHIWQMEELCSAVIHVHSPKAVCSIQMKYSENKVISVTSPIKQKCRYWNSQLDFLANRFFKAWMKNFLKAVCNYQVYLDDNGVFTILPIFIFAILVGHYEFH